MRKCFSGQFLRLISTGGIVNCPCLREASRQSPDSQNTNSMGQQHRKVIKRRRRELYLKRKKELLRSKIKLGATAKK
jgi:hypothetical protein